MRVNVTSTMLMAKYTIPEMMHTSLADKSKGTGKLIVNLSSVAGVCGGHHTLLYPNLKGAIINMIRAMAAHHGLDGIQVNAIAPGMAYTPMVNLMGMLEVLREAVCQKISLVNLSLCQEQERDVDKWVTTASFVITKRTHHLVM